MVKLTPTMLEGLRKMALKLKRQSSVMAEPNDNTGRALEKRGLIAFAGKSGKWNRYVLTDAGRAALERSEG